jgi:hypothetical protein
MMIFNCPEAVQIGMTLSGAGLAREIDARSAQISECGPLIAEHWTSFPRQRRLDFPISKPPPPLSNRGDTDERNGGTQSEAWGASFDNGLPDAADSIKCAQRLLAA